MLVPEVKHHGTDGPGGTRLRDDAATAAASVVQFALHSARWLRCNWAPFGVFSWGALWMIGEHIYRWPWTLFTAAHCTGSVLAYRREQEQEIADNIGRLTAWCHAARIDAPEFLDWYPTDTGEAFVLRVTRLSDHDGRPMTVDTFVSLQGLMRDVIGDGCLNVHIEPDRRNGGRCTMYVQWYEVVEPAPVVVQVHEHRTVVAHTAAQLEEALREADEHRRAQLDTGPIEVTATDEEASGGARNGASPLDMRASAPREGRAVAWSAPTTGPVHDPRLFAPPAPDPRYPRTIVPGSADAVLFDLLRDDVPRARGYLVAHGPGYSPPTVSARLAAWRDAGYVEDIAGCWRAIPVYRTSCTLQTNGDDEGPDGE